MTRKNYNDIFTHLIREIKLIGALTDEHLMMILSDIACQAQGNQAHTLHWLFWQRNQIVRARLN